MLLGALGALLVGGYLYLKLDDQIRNQVESILAEHYTGLEVHVASAQLIEKKGIEVRGITVLAPRELGEPEELIRIEEMLLACQPTLEELIANRLNIATIEVRRPILRIAPRPDGSLPASRLLPLPRISETPPKIVVADGRLELYRDPAAPPLVLQGGDLRITTQSLQEPGRPAREAMVVEGSVSGDLVERLKFSATVDPKEKRWRATGTAQGLRACPELCRCLPQSIPEPWNRLVNLDALGVVQFDLHGVGMNRQDLKIQTHCQLVKGTFADPHLPESVTDLSAQVRLEGDCLHVDELTGRMGKARLRMTLRRDGLSGQGPLRLVLNVAKLRLDDDLYKSLPEAAQTLWNQFLPAGEVDLDGEFVHDGATWHSRAVAHCREAAFSYHKFPYRLEQGEGTLTLNDKKLALDLVAFSGNRPVTIRGELDGLDRSALGWVEVKGSRLTPNTRLIEALPGKAREIVESLEPSGEFQVSWRGWRDDPGQKQLHTHLTLDFENGAVRYQRFPYPLQDIRGRAEARDGHWTFSDLVGMNDAGKVTCRGEMRPTPAGNELLLHFSGAQIPLEEELRDALGPRCAPLWDELRPTGKLDLKANVAFREGGKLDLGVRLEPRGEAAIEPRSFPYRFENLTGAVIYDNGKVYLERLRAAHGPTRITTRGAAEKRDDGSWYLQLDGLAVDGATADRDLLLALPSRLRAAVNKLNPTGTIALQGSLGLSRAAEPYAPVRGRWDLALNMHQGTLDCGLRLENIFGDVRLAGNYDGSRFQSTGELAVDSLTCRNVQFTDLLGPLWIDDQQVLLGAAAEKRSGKAENSRHITGHLYSGQLIGDGWVTLEETPRYGLEASLVGGDLQRFARECVPGQQQLKGSVLGQISLKGNASGLHSLEGQGAIQLRDADIYELPLSVALLKVLRARVPDSTAFNASSMTFRVAGSHFYFDQFNLLGDVISLYGKGEADFSRRINMTFHSQVGPGHLEAPIWRRLVGEASQQIMQIHVNGTVDEPVIVNEPFPVVNEALQQLQADLNPSSPPAKGAATPEPWSPFRR